MEVERDRSLVSSFDDAFPASGGNADSATEKARHIADRIRAGGLANLEQNLEESFEEIGNLSQLGDEIFDMAEHLAYAIDECADDTCAVSTPVPAAPTLISMSESESPQFPGVVENNGRPVEYCAEQFQNWGHNITNCPVVTFFPKSKVAVQNIVKYAKENGLSVRASGYRHTWTDFYSSNDQVLVSLLSSETVNVLPEKLPPLDHNNDLMGMTVLSVDEDGEHCLCKIGAATTNDMFRQWALENNWTVPMNVIMVEITIGGSNATICHGAGLRNATLCDIVREIEFVNSDGNIKTISEPELLRSAAGCFGMLGVVVSVTLRLDKMTAAILTPRKIDTSVAIPAPPGFDMPDGYRQLHGAEYEEALRNFINKATESYYSEFFWFVYQKKVWVNCWKTDADLKGTVAFPTPLTAKMQAVLTYMANVFNKMTSKGDVAARIQAGFLGTTAMAALPNGKTIKAKLIDALHFQRGIQNMRVWDTEWEIPVPDDGNGKADWSIAQRAWWDMIKLVTADENIDMRLTMEMRIMGASNIIMAAQTGNVHGTVSIEVLTPRNVTASEWLRFTQKTADLWTRYKDVNGTPLNIRPHWAKNWQNIAVGGRDVVSHLREFCYRDSIPEFKAGLQQCCESTESDFSSLHMFSNPFLRELFREIYALDS